MIIIQERDNVRHEGVQSCRAPTCSRFGWLGQPALRRSFQKCVVDRSRACWTVGTGRVRFIELHGIVLNLKENEASPNSACRDTVTSPAASSRWPSALAAVKMRSFELKDAFPPSTTCNTESSVVSSPTRRRRIRQKGVSSTATLTHTATGIAVDENQLTQVEDETSKGQNKCQSYFRSGTALSSKHDLRLSCQKSCKRPFSCFTSSSVVSAVAITAS